METSILYFDQFEHCLGSSNYQICSEIFSTEIRYSSFNAILFFECFVDALPTCDTSFVSLRSTEEATSLDIRIWPRTSTSEDFIFRETYATSSSSKTQSFTGCPSCIIALEISMQFPTKTVTIRSDLVNGSQIPNIKLRVSLPHSLASFIMRFPPSGELPL